MPGAKLLPRSPEVGWALRDEDAWGWSGWRVVNRMEKCDDTAVENSNGSGDRKFWMFVFSKN